MNLRNMLRHNDGSRKLVGQEYAKNYDNSENKGPPFPKNVRPIRRNRPHRRNRVQNDDQEYVVTAEDLADRNPIITIKQVMDISEEGKALFRKSQKFCPTPRGPIQEMEHYKDFLGFQQSLRWKWFFNKDIDPNDIDDEFIPKPWDTRNERRDPFATDAPELEAFLSATEKDVRNLDLRRKISSNLSQYQWSFIKEVQEDYPKRGLRLRMENSCGTPDFMETTQENLVRVGHQGGPKCRCSECQKIQS
jgi:hypothetical protein